MSIAVQFAVTPNFGYLAFSDEASLSEAVVHVYRIRNKNNVDTQVLQKIVDKTGATTVGDLRRLTDHDWKTLDVPAILRLYLKYVVRQSNKKRNSGPKTFMDQLADDFNYGQPFDMSLYQNHVSMLASMGFKQEEAMEALVITENKGIEGALEILFQPDLAIRENRRKEATERLNRRVPADDEKRFKPRSDVPDGRRERYRSFIQGLIAAETIGVLAFQALQNLQKELKINDAEHKETLASLNLSVEKFDSMRNFDKKDKRDTECVVCLDRPKDHVVMPCMHMCLCEECASDFSEKSNCPICGKKVKKVVKIFV